MSNDGDDARGRQETTPFDQQVGGQPDRWQAPPGGTSGAGATAAGASSSEPPSSGQEGHGPPPYGSAPHGQGPYGQGPYGQGTYGQGPYGQAPYGQQVPYEQAPYGQQAPGPQQYGQQWAQQPYGQGQPPFPQQQYGQAPYGQAPYGQPSYGQGPYDQPYGQPQPARPGPVITAAVLGLVLGALGLLATVGLLVGGAIIDDLADAIDESDPSLGSGVADDVRAVLLVLALLALAWTVAMVWGSVLALRGRSRVLLIVGAAISVAATGLFFLGSLVSAARPPSEDGEAGGVLLTLVLFLIALATLVLPCLRSAAQFFAAHRQRRALQPR
jgi:hypothetical protein